MNKHRKAQPKLRKRKMAIIAELCRMSHKGWHNCRREDWQPLEDELNQINLMGA